MTLFTNLGFEQKCSRFLSADPTKSYVKHPIHTLCPGSSICPEGFAFDIKVIKAEHKENLTEAYAIGFILELKESENEGNAKDEDIPKSFKIGFTSDTRFHKQLTPLYECDIVVANISNAAFRELKVKMGLGELPNGKCRKPYENFLDEFNNDRPGDERSKEENDIISWSLWYRNEGDWINTLKSDENQSDKSDRYRIENPSTLPAKLKTLLTIENNKLFCDNIQVKGEQLLQDDNKKLLCEWADDSNNRSKIDELLKDIKNRLYPGVLLSHLGVSGVYKIWKELKDRVDSNKKLLILSEFREEMGSFRNKVASLLNEEIENNPSISNNLKCFTSDIGMAVKFVSAKSPRSLSGLTCQDQFTRHN